MSEGAKVIRRAGLARCARCGSRFEGGETCPRCPGGGPVEARRWGPAEVVRGMGYFFRGAAYLAARPDAWHYVLIPFVLNTLLFVAVLYFALTGVGGWLDGMLEDSAYWGWLWYVAMMVFVALVGLALFYTFALAGTVIAAPFTEFLSERMETEQLEGYTPPPLLWRRIVRETARATWEALKLLAVEVAAIAVLLAIGCVPVVGWIVAGAGFAAIAAVDFLDVVMARKHYRLSEKAGFVWRHRGRAIGFGVVMYLVMLVPIVNFLFIPAGVAGGTLLYLEAPKK